MSGTCVEVTVDNVGDTTSVDFANFSESGDRHVLNDNANSLQITTNYNASLQSGTMTLYQHGNLYISLGSHSVDIAGAQTIYVDQTDSKVASTLSGFSCSFDDDQYPLRD